MRSRPDPRCAFVPLLAALAIAQSGCATKFVARPANPLKPAKTSGWDPGELTKATEARLKLLHLSGNWKADPAPAIRTLEESAARDPIARRAIIEIALATGIRAHSRFLTNRGAAGYYL